MHVDRVVVGVSGSPGSLQALRYATEFARRHEAVLAPVLAWTPPGGELADRRYPSPELRAVWKQAAWDRLWKAIDLGIGGPPADVTFRPEVVQDAPGMALSAFAHELGDVLIIGAGRHSALRRILSCRVGRYCMAHATCPVIAVPPLELTTEPHGLRGRRDRHRLHPEHAGLHSAGA